MLNAPDSSVKVRPVSAPPGSITRTKARGTGRPLLSTTVPATSAADTGNGRKRTTDGRRKASRRQAVACRTGQRKRIVLLSASHAPKKDAPGARFPDSRPTDSVLTPSRAVVGPAL